MSPVKLTAFTLGQVGMMMLARFFFQWILNFAASSPTQGDETLFSAAAVGTTLLAFRVFDGVTATGFVQAGQGGVQNLAGAYTLRVSPDGRNVYVAPRNHDRPASFRLAPDGGLTELPAPTLPVLNPEEPLTDGDLEGDDGAVGLQGELPRPVPRRARRRVVRRAPRILSAVLGCPVSHSVVAPRAESARHTHSAPVY